MFSRRAALAALLALSACGGFPQPHRGNPGGLAGGLRIPLAVRLAIPPPPEALLTDDAALRYAEAVSEALQAVDVPATATATPLPLDWRLIITAQNTGAIVIPRYVITNADGQEQGAVAGPPVPARAWAEASTPTLQAVAQQASPRVTQMLLSVQAARASADPAAIQAGPPRLRLIPVRGAPGDGNMALTARLREFLGNRGYVVQDVADGASFAVTAEVSVVAAGPGLQRVEIQWIVSRRDGYELGRVLQLNEIPTGALSRAWGDIAYAAAEEAAGGVQTIIRNATSPG
ncbi:hypothetical protein [Sediminicoccus sp. KRV36]|uniref:hypothetical protein n=1 Tax=Sediminicoccus sp. KRV36 TaxID=3133721 RepID=UPI00200FE121|nr:hypothetical protein [Sediminicoccus rosea]UPY39269.1 hypothetical protein LHU95_11420 [Sediminicoccus rosea]